MAKGLIEETAEKAGVKEDGLRVTLSRIKKRHDLKSIEQAACFYVKKKGLDINVSSIIDDVTRNVVQRQLSSQTPAAQSQTPNVKSKPKQIIGPNVKWVPKSHYDLAPKLRDFYPYLFIFENALRLKIEEVMSNNYSSNWWDTRLKNDLSDIWKSADREKQNQAKLPMIGQTNLLQPIEYITIGQLEQIIVKYQSLFVPLVFLNLQFFTGHMVIVKRVRNAIAHMSPSTTASDIRHAKNEINILLAHLATVK